MTTFCKLIELHLLFLFFFSSLIYLYTISTLTLAVYLISRLQSHRSYLKISHLTHFRLVGRWNDESHLGGKMQQLRAFKRQLVNNFCHSVEHCNDSGFVGTEQHFLIKNQEKKNSSSKVLSSSPYWLWQVFTQTLHHGLPQGGDAVKSLSAGRQLLAVKKSNWPEKQDSPIIVQFVCFVLLFFPPQLLQFFL